MEDVKVRITVDSNEANKGLGSLGDQFSNLNPRIGRFFDGLGGIAVTLNPLTAGLSLLATGVQNLASFIQESTYKFAEWDKGVREITTLLDDETLKSIGGKEQIVSDLEEIQRSFGQTGDVINKAYYQALSSGVSADAVDSFLELSGKLATGGATDMATAVNGLTNLANAYQISYNDTEKLSLISDTLFTGMKYGKTTVDELSRGLGKTAPIAATMGVNFDELVASVSAVTTAGVSTSQAITQVNSILNKILRPSKAASETMSLLGISFGETALQNQNLQEWLTETDKKLKESGKNFSDLFGNVRALSGVMSLTGSTADKYNTILEKMAENTENAGMQTEMAFEKMKGLQFYIDQTNQNMEVFSQRVGKALGPVLSYILDIQNSLIDLATNIFLPTQAAKDSFNELTDSINKTDEALYNVSKVTGGSHFKFTQDLIMNQTELDRIINQISISVPELGNRLRKLADSDILNLDDKVRLLNKTMTDFINLSGREMKESVKTFTDSQGDVIKKYQESQKRVTSLRNELEVLNRLNEQSQGGYQDQIDNLMNLLNDYNIEMASSRQQFINNAVSDLSKIQGLDVDIIREAISKETGVIQELYTDVIKQFEEQRKKALVNITESSLDAFTSGLEKVNIDRFVGAGTQIKELINYNIEYKESIVEVNETLEINEELEKKRAKTIEDVLKRAINLSKDYNKIVEDMADIEAKILKEQEEMRKAIAEAEKKYNEDLLKQQEKIAKQEQKIYDYRIDFYDKINKKIDDIDEKLASEQEKVTERLKVKTNVLQSDFRKMFPELSYLDNISDQIFDSAESTDQNITQALQFLQKTVPDNFEKTLKDIEKIASDIRQDVMNEYLTESDILLFGASEEGKYQALISKFGEQKTKDILATADEEILKTQEKLLQSRVDEIKIIDDSNIDKLTKEKEELLKTNIEEDKTYQNLNKQLEEYNKELQDININDYMKDVEKHKQRIADLRSEYQVLTNNLVDVSEQVNSFASALGDLDFSGFSETQQKVIKGILEIFTTDNLNIDTTSLENLMLVLKGDNDDGLISSLINLGAIDNAGLKKDVSISATITENLKTDLQDVSDTLDILQGQNTISIQVFGQELLVDDVRSAVTTAESLLENPLTATLGGIATGALTYFTGDLVDDDGNIKTDATIQQFKTSDQAVRDLYNAGDKIADGFTDMIDTESIGNEIGEAFSNATAEQIANFMSLDLAGLSPDEIIAKIRGQSYAGGLVTPPNIKLNSPNAYDDQLTWIQTGEFVVKKDSVNKYGVDFLDKLNKGKLDVTKLNTDNTNIKELSKVVLNVKNDNKPSTQTNKETKTYNNTYNNKIVINDSKKGFNNNKINESIITICKEVLKGK